MEQCVKEKPYQGNRLWGGKSWACWRLVSKCDNRVILEDGIGIGGPELLRNPVGLVFGQGWTWWKGGLKEGIAVAQAEDDSGQMRVTEVK